MFSKLNKFLILKIVSCYAAGFLLLLIGAEVLNEIGLVVLVLDGSLVKKLIYVPDWYFDFLYPLLALFSALTLGKWGFALAFTTFSTFFGFRVVALVSSLTIAIVKTYRERLRVISGFSAAIIALELSTIAYYATRAGRIEVPLLEYSAYWDLAIRLFLSPLTPLIVVIFLTIGYILLVKSLFFKKEYENVEASKLYVTVGVLIALTVSYAIYSPLLNPGLRIIGVDTRVYYPRFIANATRYGLSYIIGKRERSLFVLMLYLLYLFVGEKTALILLTPITLTLYTIASYVMARELLGNRVAKYAALIAPLNYTITAGIFSAYYNNLVATSIIFFATALIEKWLKSRELKYFILAVLLLELAVYTHSFMAMFYSIVLGLYAVFKRGRTRAVLLLLAIAVAIQSLPSISFWVSKESAKAIAKAPLSFSENWWDGVDFVIYNCAAALAVNPLEWILAIIGALGARDLLLASWLTVGGSLSLFSSPQQWVLRWRSLYAIPLAIFQAKGLALLEERNRVSAYAMLAVQAAYTTASLTGILGV